MKRSMFPVLVLSLGMAGMALAAEKGVVQTAIAVTPVQALPAVPAGRSEERRVGKEC